MQNLTRGACAVRARTSLISPRHLSTCGLLTERHTAQPRGCAARNFPLEGARARAAGRCSPRLSLPRSQAQVGARRLGQAGKGFEGPREALHY